MRYIQKDGIQKITQYCLQNSIDFVLIIDQEYSRDSNVRYISGLPMDGQVLLSKTGKIYIRAWDILLAKKLCKTDFIVSMDEMTLGAFITNAMEKESSKQPMIEISSRYPISFKQTLEDLNINVVAKLSNSVFDVINSIRTIKSKEELKIIKEGMAITNELINCIGPFIAGKKECTESDLAFYLMHEAKKRGAEKESFEYLVANRKRSWGIHAFPASTGQPLNFRGLALIDFGILYNGYCTDVTIPMSFGKLTDTEKKVVDIVIKVHDESIKAIRPGLKNHEIAAIATKVLKTEGYTMPHPLGHGLGLDLHEFPSIAETPKDPSNLKNWKEVDLKPGMLFTIEPGIYDEKFGGFRLEDDVLVTNSGVEVLTKAKYYAFDYSI